MAQNKVNFGLKNCYWATYKIGPQGTPVYNTPKKLPGAVSLTLDLESSNTVFYADDIAYYQIYSGSQFTGELEVADIPQDFAVEVLGEKLIANNVLAESSSITRQPFAFLFEVQGDQKATRYCFFSVTCSKPGISANTVTESVEVDTKTLSFTAVPREGDELTRIKTTDSTLPGLYDTWFLRVYDGIVNTIPQPGTASHVRTTGNAINITVQTTGAAKVTGIKNNGTALRLTNDYTYQEQQNQVTLTKAYLDSLPNSPTDKPYDIVIETDKGNFIHVPLTVTGA